MPEEYRILLIDDEAGSREGLTLLLRREGYAIDAVDSGEAALTRLPCNLTKSSLPTCSSPA